MQVPRRTICCGVPCRCISLAPTPPPPLPCSRRQPAPGAMISSPSAAITSRVPCKTFLHPECHVNNQRHQHPIPVYQRQCVLSKYFFFFPFIFLLLTMAAVATSDDDNPYPSVATSTSMFPDTTSVTTITMAIIKLPQHCQRRLNPYSDNDDVGTHLCTSPPYIWTRARMT